MDRMPLIPPTAAHHQAPTRSEVAAALVTVCDILLASDAVLSDSEMPTKLRAIKNYADTMFSGGDCNKMRDALAARPNLLAALRASDMETACRLLEQEKANDKEGQLEYALGCVSKVHPTLSSQDTEALWEEIHLICELVED